MSAVPPPAGLDESERERALERLHILKPFLEDGVPLPRISKESGVPLGRYGGRDGARGCGANSTERWGRTLE